jgi:hypothetical protein
MALPFFLCPALLSITISTVALKGEGQRVQEESAPTGPDPIARALRPLVESFFQKTPQCLLSLLVVTLTGSGKRRKILRDRAGPRPVSAGFP